MLRTRGGSIRGFVYLLILAIGLAALGFITHLAVRPLIRQALERGPTHEDLLSTTGTA